MVVVLTGLVMPGPDPGIRCLQAELPTEPAITGTEKSAGSAKALLRRWQATIAAMALLVQRAELYPLEDRSRTA
jgi:hypothetical protein